MWRQMLGWEVSCATGLRPPSLGSSSWRVWRCWEEELQLPENTICVLAAASWHNHEEEDCEGSQQFWVGKGWQISPHVLPNFHARICPALALPMGISRMCRHPRLSWVTPGPPVQQQGGESLGQSESLGADFHGLFIFQVFWCVGCNYSSTSEAKQEQKIFQPL